MLPPGVAYFRDPESPTVDEELAGIHDIRLAARDGRYRLGRSGGRRLEDANTLERDASHKNVIWATGSMFRDGASIAERCWEPLVKFHRNRRPEWSGPRMRRARSLPSYAWLSLLMK